MWPAISRPATHQWNDEKNIEPSFFATNSYKALLNRLKWVIRYGRSKIKLKRYQRTLLAISSLVTFRILTVVYKPWHIASIYRTCSATEMSVREASLYIVLDEIQYISKTVSVLGGKGPYYTDRPVYVCICA